MECIQNLSSGQGPMAAYFNYTIRNRLIDRLRKENRHDEIKKKAIHEEITKLSDGNWYSEQTKVTIPLIQTFNFSIDDPGFWKHLKVSDK
ncbi:hypothetical protein [Virgibacillus doumboii]|uniref:hypothetical protein n=1 Tax=Virgibacillus doumboii TaxID=2697503 RepID=UPI00196730C8|nr:hypothetical protein [Virgibacillus doumboii]